jgi:creatinine amidohydrolase
MLANADMTVMPWPQFEERARDAPFFVLATGSLEQHGPHLPLGADSMVAQGFARMVAERHAALLLPPMTAGVNFVFRDWPGSLDVGAPVLAGYVRGLAESVRQWSPRLLIVNGHDENQDILQTVSRELAPDVDVIVLEWAHVALDEIVKIGESRHERHAGELLTSLFLHWFPESVRVDLIHDSPAPDRGHTTDDLHVAQRAFRPAAVPYTGRETGVYGTPSLATADKGRAIAEAVTARIDELLDEVGWKEKARD